MVKTYNKYELSQTFGLVTSAVSNVVSVSDRNTRTIGPGIAVVGANEEVLTWDVKKGELLSRWRDSNSTSQVTVITRSAVDSDVFAVGYDDGTIRIWDSRIDSTIINFNGHKSAVTSLAFDQSGARLASGAKDTDIIIWDLVQEVGLFKLRGHKDQIVGIEWIYPETEDGGTEGDVTTSNNSDDTFILSASKDALLKLWNVSSQHCVETHLSQTNGECWAMAVSTHIGGSITAGSDGELKVWSIDLKGLARCSSTMIDSPDTRFLSDRGVLRRHGRERTVGVCFHPRADFFAVHGAEKAVEVWRIRSEVEVQKSLARKRRRRKERANAAAEKAVEDGDADMANGGDEHMDAPTINDFFVMDSIIRTGGKVSAVDWIDSKARKSVQLLATSTNNMLEVYNIPVITRKKSNKSEPPESPEYTRTFSVELPGHRTDVRSISLSSDDQMLATASSGSLKIWNVQTGACLRTLECGYALCCSFLPGDKMVVVGTKSGEMELFDIASSSLIESSQAHEGSIWALQVHPDGRSMVTGAADKTAKFWNFEIVQEEIAGTRRTTPRLKLVHTRTLKVNDDILSLCFSPDSRLLAVSTLDNTVKVFFNDSLKLFLNLYGHKLPVLSMSISSDSKVMATCSADKNIRLWGLDFGDCHKAFFGHSDSVMQVKFIASPASTEDGHTFFSASKDRFVKTWDGDKFEQVQRLGGHHGEIWAMAVSRSGDFLVTASHDKSVRVWIMTDEPIFLEEERERELEELYESTLTASLEADGGLAEDDNDDPEKGVGGGRGAAAAASKQTTATLTAGERIIEALELGLEDLKLVQEWEAQKATTPNLAPPQRDPLFVALGNISAERHVLNAFARVPAAQLHDALLVLPFAALPALFVFVDVWIRRRWDVPLVCRLLFFMLRTHQRQIVASGGVMKRSIEGLRDGLRLSLGEIRDLMGYNVAALKCIEERVRENGVATLEDAIEADEQAGGKTRNSAGKRAFADVA